MNSLLSFSRLSFSCLSLCLVCLAACGGSTSTTDAGTDAHLSTDAGADASVDASAPDSGAPDAAIAIDGGPGADGGSTPDGGASSDGGVACDYVGVDEVIVRCAGEYTFVSQFLSTVGPPACPTFFGFDLDGARFESFEAAVASDPACDATCQYHFALSVSRIHCGHRDGYEVLRATDCPDVYRFAEGYYASVEEHDAAHPCP